MIVALIGRLFVIAFSLFCAMIAAGFAIAIGLLGPDWHGFSGDIGDRVFFWGLVIFGTGFTGAVGFMPVVVLIALAEAFKIRALVVYAVVGAALLALGLYGGGNPTGEESIDNPPAHASRPYEIAAASGAVFGLVYWLLAGRNAGRWRERKASKA